MKQTRTFKRVSLILCILLIAASVWMTGCNETNTPVVTPTQTATATDVTQVGKGNTSFAFTVVDKEGNQTHFTVYTDQTTVGAALLENNLIEGEQGDYGLYVKSVNGISADFNTDGTYWAFYVNDAYAMAGVDLTPIKEGETYSFRVEK